LGQWRVTVDRAMDDERCPSLSLNYSLLMANVAAPDQRVLVVAVGSNASPDVMRRKFEKHGVSDVLPFINGKLHDIGIAHSAHVSAAGYVAAAPYFALGAATPVFASLLDRRQLRCLDDTEPNYVRRLVSSAQCRLELEGGEEPECFYVYDSMRGVIAKPGMEPFPLASQEGILTSLRTQWPEFLALFGEIQDPAVALKALGADEFLRAAVRDALVSTDWARPSGLTMCPATSDARTYGGGGSSWRGGSAPSDDALESVATRDELERLGEQCVVLHPADASARGLSGHAMVCGPLSAARHAALARVVLDPAQERGFVGVDQVVRNALGIELREPVLLTPASPRRIAVADAVIARPHFVMSRVQAADLGTVEQAVCLMTPLSMGILGVQDGDEVVIEGAPAEGAEVPVVRLRAHPIPEDTVERRRRISGGDLDSRFPSARDALGVYPDLPWIFLDSTSRSTLGVAKTKLAVVRVRAGRRHQLSREMRELLLLLVLAFVGLASVVESRALLTGVLVLVLAATGFVVRSRLRSRL
jgi:hypothetical protein